MAGAAEYNRYIVVAGNTVPFETARVAGTAAWGGLTGVVMQHV